MTLNLVKLRSIAKYILNNYSSTMRIPYSLFNITPLQLANGVKFVTTTTMKENDFKSIRFSNYESKFYSDCLLVSFFETEFFNILEDLDMIVNSLKDTQISFNLNYALLELLKMIDETNTENDIIEIEDDRVLTCKYKMRYPESPIGELINILFISMVSFKTDKLVYTLPSIVDINFRDNEYLAYVNIFKPSIPDLKNSLTHYKQLDNSFNK